jgi:hypothetical protein
MSYFSRQGTEDLIGAASHGQAEHWQKWNRESRTSLSSQSVTLAEPDLVRIRIAPPAC